MTIFSSQVQNCNCKVLFAVQSNIIFHDRGHGHLWGDHHDAWALCLLNSAHIKSESKPQSMTTAMLRMHVNPITTVLVDKAFGYMLGHKSGRY